MISIQFSIFQVTYKLFKEVVFVCFKGRVFYKMRVLFLVKVPTVCENQKWNDAGIFTNNNMKGF